MSTVAPSFTSSLFIEHCILLCIAPAGVPTETTINSHLPQTPLKSEPASFLLNIRVSLQSEIDISVSKLLGFETFANFLRVSVSVSENLVSEKSLSFGFGKFGLGKKVSVSVSKKLVSEKSLGFGFREFGLKKKSQFRSKFGIVIQWF